MSSALAGVTFIACLFVLLERYQVRSALRKGLGFELAIEDMPSYRIGKLLRAKGFAKVMRRGSDALVLGGWAFYIALAIAAEYSSPGLASWLLVLSTVVATHHGRVIVRSFRTLRKKRRAA
jgi:hypothetical protein